LTLTTTTDIAQALGQRKKKQYLVGFALETQDGLENAKMKLKKKNLDIIVLNSLEDQAVAFGADTNKVTIVEPNGDHIAYPAKQKTEVAADIIDFIIQKYHA
jgi:phosphopantothenoylcysteine decarboxylase/phosphopantothenate--cysteine ligase